MKITRVIQPSKIQVLRLSKKIIRENAYAFSLIFSLGSYKVYRNYGV